MLIIKSGVIETAGGTTLYTFGRGYIRAFMRETRKKPARIVLQAITREGILAAEGYVPKVRGAAACNDWLIKHTVFAEDRD
jgi:hypothetical protein